MLRREGAGGRVGVVVALVVGLAVGSSVVSAQTLEARTFVPVAEVEFAHSLHRTSGASRHMLMHLGVLWAYDPRAAWGVAVRPGSRTDEVATVVELRLRRRLSDVWTVELGPGVTVESGVDQHLSAQLRYADALALTFSIDAIGQRFGKEWRTYVGVRGVGRTGLVALPVSLVMSGLIDGSR